MPRIHTHPGEYDFTASALIIRSDAPKPRLLLRRHKKHNIFIQPGGHLELHETPWQTILHEIQEETGYALDQLQLLQPQSRLRHLSRAILHPVPVCENSHVISTEHNHTDRLYAFTAESEPAGYPGDGETTDFQWVTADQLQDLPDSILSETIKEIGTYALKVCITQWERVPLSDFKV